MCYNRKNHWANMNKFNFNSVPNIISGPGKTDEIANIFLKNQINRPLLITDLGIKAQGYVESIKKKLDKFKR